MNPQQAVNLAIELILKGSYNNIEKAAADQVVQTLSQIKFSTPEQDGEENK